MISARDRRYLGYIRDAIELIRQSTTGGREKFENNVDARNAVLWRLETLSEATVKLSDALKERHPTLRWYAIRGFRNIIAHGYLDLNLDLVWEIIDVHLDELKVVVDEELGAG